MALKLVTAPDHYPVSLAEMQDQCNAHESDFEDMLDLCRKAATDEAEKFTGRALIEQTWDLFLDAFPQDIIAIPKPPLIEVMGVFYRDSAGDEQELAVSAYVVDDASEPARITLAGGSSWPVAQARTNAVRVRFTAGYASYDSPPDTNDVPPAIKAAIRMIGATLFANREIIVIGQTATLLPWAAEQLLRRYRVEKAMA